MFIVLCGFLFLFLPGEIHPKCITYIFVGYNYQPHCIQQHSAIREVQGTVGTYKSQPLFMG